MPRHSRRRLGPSPPRRNLKTAKALGLTIPPGVLAIADEVIGREFITLIGGAAAAWPLAARAQQPANIARIGCLVTGSLGSPEARAMVDAFRQGLRERGYVEGQNIVIEYRSADGSIERFPRLANELATTCAKGRHKPNMSRCMHGHCY